MFVNREEELNLLERAYRSGRAELLVLYGRRRVGKTELLRTFCQGKEHVFFVADLNNEKELLDLFSRRLWESQPGRVPEGVIFPSWETAIQFVGTLAKDQRLVLVLDEFPYMAQASLALPSILQRLWDSALKDTRILLILCGSYVGFMEKEVLAYRSPLYGRRTGQCLLEPLSYLALAAFFPRYSPREWIQTYAVLGGMPAYWLEFDAQVATEENIRTHILRKGALLYEEARFLLMEELREPRNYFAILRAIAHGRTKLNEIVQDSGVGERNVVSRYVDILRELKLVEREVPVTERRPDRSRRGTYQLTDHYLRFWFRFVHPNRSLIEEGFAEEVLEKRVLPFLSEFIGPIFERVAIEYLQQQARQGAFSFTPERIGRWWDAGSEIDVVAFSAANRQAIVAECKWTNQPVKDEVLASLKSRAAALAKREGWTISRYFIFAKSGVRKELQNRAVTEEVSLVSLGDLFAGSRERGATNTEQGATSTEQGAGSREPRAKGEG
jgi:hypothetical protein